MLTKASPQISRPKTNSETVQPVQNQSPTLPDFSNRRPKLTPDNVLALQWTVGNQAVTRLIARQKSNAVSTTILRKNNDKGKHKDNFMRYLFTSIPGGYNQKDVNHKQAGARAWVLDQNVYDSKIILDAAAGDWASLEEAIDPYQQSRLDKAGLDLATDIVPLLKFATVQI